MTSLATACVLQLPLNDCRRDTIVRARRGNSALSQRNTQFMSVDGKFGGALGFNGSSDYVDTNSLFNTVFNASFTVACRIKPTDGHNALTQFILGCETRIDDEPVYGLAVNLDDQDTGKIVAYINCGTGYLQVISPAEVFADGAADWKHLIITVEQVTPTTATLSLYIDNVLLVTDTDNMILSQWASTRNLYIGTVNPWDGNLIASNYFNGAIENVCVFNRVLTAAERALLQTTDRLGGAFETAASVLADMLAACSAFAAECSGDAAGFIHIGSDAGATFPMALISRVGGESGKGVGTGSVLYGGTMNLRLEKTIPAAHQASDAAATEEFGQWLDAVIAELWDESFAGGGLMIRSMTIETGPFRYEDEEHKNICGAYVAIQWGMGQ